MNAQQRRDLSCKTRAAVLFILCVITADLAFAQSAAPQPAQPRGQRLVDSVKFVGGGLLALGMHEGGHLVFDAAFDADPFVRRVHFGPFPFFAISHRSDLSPRREFTVSSAGFWVQEATSEWLLTRRPDVRHDHAPFLKGILAFNVLTSVGYAAVAMAKAGPSERDTRGMADSIDLDERVIGVIVLMPAVLDASRYFDPDARWVKWASRAAKIGSVLMVLKGRSQSSQK